MSLPRRPETFRRRTSTGCASSPSTSSEPPPSHCCVRVAEAVSRALRQIPYFNPVSAGVYCDATLMIQTRQQQKARSADCVREKGGPEHQRGSGRALCSVAGIPDSRVGHKWVEYGSCPEPGASLRRADESNRRVDYCLECARVRAHRSPAAAKMIVSNLARRRARGVG